MNIHRRQGKQFFLGVPQHSAERGVYPNELIGFVIEDRQSVRHAVENRLKVVAALLQGFGPLLDELFQLILVPLEFDLHPLALDERP